MLQEITQYISCLCSVDKFEEAKAAGYGEIYIIQHDRTFMKYAALTNGRSILMSIPDLPPAAKKLLQAPPPKLAEEIHFLPAGKVPYILLKQIVAFFKQVMAEKKADYEAQAFILWNQERGYHISVPKQTVSRAAVSFEYDSDAIPQGSILVVDLH